MTKIGFGGRSKLPKVNYYTALDYFVIMCFIQVFGTIVEYAAIVFYERKVKRRRLQILDKLKELEEKAKAREEQEQEAADEQMMVGRPKHPNSF